MAKMALNVNKLGPKMASLEHITVNWGSPMTNLGPKNGHVGSQLVYYRPNSYNLGPYLYILDPNSAIEGPNLAISDPNLTLFWAPTRPIWIPTLLY